MNKLTNDYNPRNPKKVEEKKIVLESAKKLLNARKDIIDFFEKGIFLYRGHVFTTKENEETRSINYDLFEDYFNFAAPTDLAKKIIQNKR